MRFEIIRKAYTTRRPNRRTNNRDFQNFTTVKWEIYEGERWVATYNFKRDAVNRLNRLNPS